MKVSFVVPIYNDGELAADFCEEFSRVLCAHFGVASLEGVAELIFVDDGSRNDSAKVVASILPRFPFARLIVLSRNFGQHIALSCGYEHATGAYVGMLNVDMEDPPAEIPRLLAVLDRDEADIVTGIRPLRRGPIMDRITSKLFNWTLNRLTGANVPTNAATLRVMNRRFVDAYNSLEERSRYLPGLEVWIGFRHAYVPIEHRARQRGRSSYNLRRRLRMAADSIVSFSDLPLRLVALLGFIVAALGFLAVGFIVTSKLLGYEWQHGFAATISVIALLGGLQIFTTGVAAIYVGRVLREVQRRPLYIVREKRNFPEA